MIKKGFNFKVTIISFLLVIIFSCKPSVEHSYKNPKLPIDERVKDFYQR